MSDIFDPFRLDGKTAFITGASSGLGRHFADVLSQAGANIVLAARRKERLDQAVVALEEAGGNAHAVQLDVTEDGSVDDAFSKAAQAFGGIDIVINNAGIAASNWFIDTKPDEWRGVMDVNLDGVFRVGQIAARHMVAGGQGGSIVNIASVAGMTPVRLLSAYSASKAAVISLTRSMALELSRDNIRVNALAPGYFSTEINQDYLNSPGGQKLLSKIPFQRAGELCELDGVLLLLASDAGSFMTGSIVAVDGGAGLSIG